MSLEVFTGYLLGFALVAALVGWRIYRWFKEDDKDV